MAPSVQCAGITQRLGDQHVPSYNALSGQGSSVLTRLKSLMAFSGVFPSRDDKPPVRASVAKQDEPLGMTEEITGHPA